MQCILRKLLWKKTKNIPPVSTVRTTVCEATFWWSFWIGNAKCCLHLKGVKKIKSKLRMMKGITFYTESVNWNRIAEHNLLFQDLLDKPSGLTFVIVSSGDSACFPLHSCHLLFFWSALQPAWEDSFLRLYHLPLYGCPLGQILNLFEGFLLFIIKR